jgi:hypothetical protein
MVGGQTIPIAHWFAEEDARPDETGAAAVVSDSPLSAHAETARIRFWLAGPN